LCVAVDLNVACVQGQTVARSLSDDDVDAIAERVVRLQGGLQPRMADVALKELETLGAPANILAYLKQERDGAALLLRELPTLYPPASVAAQNAGSSAFRIWELIGLYYLGLERRHEAVAIFSSLYGHLCASQRSGPRVHKGNPLLWLLECYSAMGFPAISKRFLMLTLCEDAMGYKGEIDANSSGLYFRAVWRFGLSDEQIRTFSKRVYEIHQEHPEESKFPEWVLQELDPSWMDVVPSSAESFVYTINSQYIRLLMEGLGSSSGMAMERLCEYIMSCMPGCRTFRKARTPSTDYDIVCSINGFDLDFRSELGRYFVCECKDWSSPADFTTMAKFCRVLDSTKSRFGILFSKNGISGAGKTTNSEREQLKVFQDRGMVIVAVDNSEIEAVAGGANFISILRQKYEKVRLDLLEIC
jgi:hypothetical protein